MKFSKILMVIPLFFFLILIGCGKGSRSRNTSEVDTVVSETVEKKVESTAVEKEVEKVEKKVVKEPVKKQKVVKKEVTKAVEPAPAGEKTVEFVIANAADPTSLDPHKMITVPDRYVYSAFFEGLVRPEQDTGLGSPGLAVRWTVSDDGRTYNITLREGIQWSDEVAITAETVVASWLRILDPRTRSPNAWYVASFIKGAEAFNKSGSEADRQNVAVRALNDRTLQFETLSFQPYVIDSLYHFAFSVLPMHVIARVGDNWTLPQNFVSSGPFTLKEWRKGRRLVGNKNVSYWDSDNVFIDDIVFLPTRDRNRVYNMFFANEVDLVRETPYNKYGDIAEDPNMYSYASFGTYFYEFNTSQGPMSDKRVRLAFYKAMQREVLTGEVLDEGHIPAWGLVAPMPGYTSPTFPEEDEYEARRLLSRAGYPDGEGFPNITLLYNGVEGHEKTAQYIKERIKEVLNIDITVEERDEQSFISDRANQRFDLVRNSWVGDYLDPTTFLDSFQSQNRYNYGKYENKRYDSLLERAHDEEGRKRMTTLQRVERMLIDDAAIIPLYYFVEINLIDRNKWGGWHGNRMNSPSYVGLRKISE